MRSRSTPTQRGRAAKRAGSTIIGRGGAAYERDALEVCHPVRRASHVATMGVARTQLSELITLTQAEQHFLAEVRDAAIGDAYTVPAAISGQAIRSCSFAVATGMMLPVAALPSAYITGSAALEAARWMCAPWRDVSPLPALAAQRVRADGERSPD